MINYQSHGNIVKPASVYTFPLALLIISDDCFETILKEVLDEHALIKRKFLRANSAPYMTETFRKAIIRSQLETKYFKTNTQEIYIYLRNSVTFPVNLRNFSSKLWKTIKPFLSDIDINTSRKKDKITTDHF